MSRTKSSFVRRCAEETSWWQTNMHRHLCISCIHHHLPDNCPEAVVGFFFFSSSFFFFFSFTLSLPPHS